MNNNNRGNNRRRGRGNNRQQGGQPLNRIDSRARSNAPQLLEKYRKMALDAHLNGDRVQEEYYLQFADHYFRVLADQRQRQDDGRPRRDDRGPDQYDAEGDEQDAGSAGDARHGGYDRSRYDSAEDEDPRRGGPESPELDDSEDSVSDNPFVRDNREARQNKPRRRPRGADEDGDKAFAPASGAESPSGLDPSILPPAISANSAAASDEGKPQAEAKPRRRTRRIATPVDDSDEPIEAVN